MVLIKPLINFTVLWYLLIIFPPLYLLLWNLNYAKFDESRCRIFRDLQCDMSGEKMAITARVRKIFKIWNGECWLKLKLEVIFILDSNYFLHLVIYVLHENIIY